MPLFRPRVPCPNCSADVKQPRDPSNFLCPYCNQPGPWATPEQRASWGEQERARQAALRADEARRRQEEADRLTARRRELEAAASLTPIQVPGFISQKTEQVYLAMPAKLAEWKKQSGHYEGGTGFHGVSMRIPGTKSMRAYYGGLNQRHLVPGEEGWQFTDLGTAVITNKRVVFRGQSKAVEWSFTKLVGADADRTNNCLVLQESNRQHAHVLQLDDLELFGAAFEAAVRGEPGLPDVVEPLAGLSAVATTCDVVLQDAGELKIQMIKQVRALTRLSLKQAKDAVDGAPTVILRGIPLDQAEAARATLLHGTRNARVDVLPSGPAVRLPSPSA